MTSGALLLAPLQAYLDAWRWKAGDGAVLVAASLSGDLFYRETDGTILWIDAGAGEIEIVAADEADFQHRLVDPAFCREFLLGSIVEDFLRRHGPLPIGHCIGYRQLPVVGGAYAGDNRVAIACSEHFRFTGDIHRQIDRLPDGSTIRFDIVEH